MPFLNRIAAISSDAAHISENTGVVCTAFLSLADIIINRAPNSTDCGMRVSQKSVAIWQLSTTCDCKISASQDGLLFYFGFL